MNIQFESNYGNFAYRIVAQVPEETLSAKAQALVKEGLANVAYRVAGSSVDKALGVNPKAGGRRAVEFSDDDAERINAAVTKKLTELGYKDNEISFAVTGQHVFGEENSPMKRATAFVDALMDDGDKEMQMRQTLSLFDKSAADADRDELVAIAHKAGIGIQPPKAKS